MIVMWKQVEKATRKCQINPGKIFMQINIIQNI